MKTFIADLGAHHVTDFGPPHGDDDSCRFQGTSVKGSFRGLKKHGGNGVLGKFRDALGNMPVFIAPALKHGNQSLILMPIQ